MLDFKTAADILLDFLINKRINNFKDKQKFLDGGCGKIAMSNVLSIVSKSYIKNSGYFISLFLNLRDKKPDDLVAEFTYNCIYDFIKGDITRIVESEEDLLLTDRPIYM